LSGLKKGLSQQISIVTRPSPAAVYCEYCRNTWAASKALFASGSFAWNMITVTAAPATGVWTSVVLPNVEAWAEPNVVAFAFTKPPPYAPVTAVLLVPVTLVELVPIAPDTTAPCCNEASANLKCE